MGLAGSLSHPLCRPLSLRDPGTEGGTDGNISEESSPGLADKGFVFSSFFRRFWFLYETPKIRETSENIGFLSILIFFDISPIVVLYIRLYQ